MLFSGLNGMRVCRKKMKGEIVDAHIYLDQVGKGNRNWKLKLYVMIEYIVSGIPYQVQVISWRPKD